MAEKSTAAKIVSFFMMLLPMVAGATGLAQKGYLNLSTAKQCLLGTMQARPDVYAPGFVCARKLMGEEDRFEPPFTVVSF